VSRPGEHRLISDTARCINAIAPVEVIRNASARSQRNYPGLLAGLPGLTPR